MVVHHIPPEILSTFIALYVAFTFFVTTTPSFHIVCKNFLETELEALNDKEIHLKSGRGTQLVNPG
jgi:choline-glycine betaine transporter